MKKAEALWRLSFSSSCTFWPLNFLNKHSPTLTHVFWSRLAYIHIVIPSSHLLKKSPSFVSGYLPYCSQILLFWGIRCSKRLYAILSVKKTDFWTSWEVTDHLEWHGTFESVAHFVGSHTIINLCKLSVLLRLHHHFQSPVRLSV